MIKEAYCSFEVSKLLKEKGFVGSRDIGCKDGFYSESAYESGYGIVTSSGQEVGLVFDDLDNSDLEWNEYLRPTQSLAMAWLRKEKNIVIEINMDSYMTTDDGKLKKWYSYTIWTFIQHLGEIGLVDSRFDDRAYWQENVKVGQTYEQAVEAALLYTLKNLI